MLTKTGATLQLLNVVMCGLPLQNLAWVLAAEWLLNVYIMFVGSLDGVLSGVFWAGFPEQLTGICADWTLIVVFIILYWNETNKDLKVRLATYKLFVFPCIRTLHKQRQCTVK